MDVTRTSERDLSDAQKEDLRRLQQAAFPATEEFATQRWWHTPPAGDEQWLAARRDGELIGSVRLLFRTITTAPGDDLLVGGIGNVCSHPHARGLRAAKTCMLAAERVIAAEADFGLLFTGRAVRTFYEGLGWHVVDNELIHRHGDGRDAPGHGGPDDFNLIYPGRCRLADWPAGTIELNGPDW